MGVAVPTANLGKVEEVFERNFREHGEIGASVSVWWRGEEVLSLAHGWCEREREREWTAQTLVPVYSATKGPSAACLLLALYDHGMGPETEVREVWPRFPVDRATFGELLSHQCGLAVLDRRAEVWDEAGVVDAIEAQQPKWRPGEGHGYHPRTFGVLVAHPLRLLTGRRLGEFWLDRIADPLGLDFWIGLPEREFGRVARLYPGRVEREGRADDAFFRAYNTAGTLTRDAFLSPRGLHSAGEMNQPRAWQAGFAGMGGVGSARALAKFYHAATGAVRSPLPESVCRWLAGRRADGPDLVLLEPTAFSCGCQLDPLDAAGRKLRELYGPAPEAFGHPGAGGSHAFGDPTAEISFAYTMNQMDLGVLPGLKCRELVDALYA
jgi:CubicO group peptidase (beta-lactamase class C family)